MRHRYPPLTGPAGLCEAADVTGTLVNLDRSSNAFSTHCPSSSKAQKKIGDRRLMVHGTSDIVSLDQLPATDENKVAVPNVVSLDHMSLSAKEHHIITHELQQGVYTDDCSARTGRGIGSGDSTGNSSTHSTSSSSGNRSGSNTGRTLQCELDDSIPRHPALNLRSRIEHTHAGLRPSPVGTNPPLQQNGYVYSSAHLQNLSKRNGKMFSWNKNQNMEPNKSNDDPKLFETGLKQAGLDSTLSQEHRVPSVAMTNSGGKVNRQSRENEQNYKKRNNRNACMASSRTNKPKVSSYMNNCSNPTDNSTAPEPENTDSLSPTPPPPSSCQPLERQSSLPNVFAYDQTSSYQAGGPPSHKVLSLPRSNSALSGLEPLSSVGSGYAATGESGSTCSLNVTSNLMVSDHWGPHYDHSQLLERLLNSGYILQDNSDLVEGMSQPISSYSSFDSTHLQTEAMGFPEGSVESLPQFQSIDV